MPELDDFQVLGLVRQHKVVKLRHYNIKDDVVLFDAANTDPVTWMVLAGDELAVLASMSDNSWSGGFDHTLEVSFPTTPEPAPLALLVLGGACLLLRRKRR